MSKIGLLQWTIIDHNRTQMKYAIVVNYVGSSYAYPIIEDGGSVSLALANKTELDNQHSSAITNFSYGGQDYIALTSFAPSCPSCPLATLYRIVQGMFSFIEG